MKPGNCCSRGVQKVARTLQDLLTISTPQIIVREYDHRCMAQIGAEQLFTAGVEVVAVYQSEYGHWRRFRTTLVTTPKISSTMPSVITNGG
jgi:hypothetical protein